MANEQFDPKALIIDQMSEDLWKQTSQAERERLATLYMRVSEDPTITYGDYPENLVRGKSQWQQQTTTLQAMDRTPVGERNIPQRDEATRRARILALGATGPEGNPDRTSRRLFHEKERAARGDLRETDSQGEMSRRGWHTWKERIDPSQRAKRDFVRLSNRLASHWGAKTRAEVAKNTQKNS